MITYVALPYQVYHLTGSSAVVGLIGVVQLVPLLVSALAGGATADAMDRRRLLIGAELLLAACSLGLVVNALVPHPSLIACFVIAGITASLDGFHRPALEALTPRLVPREDLPAVSALASIRGSIAAIGGPALGGVCIAAFGLGATYAIDLCSFVASLTSLAAIRSLGAPADAEAPTLRTVIEGIRYAFSRQELVGTYVVDFVAMIFGMPMALFPAIAENHGGAGALGWFYAAPSVGALLASLFSRWTHNVTRHGAAVAIAATLWGAAITVLGFVSSLWLSLLCLVLAGAADMVSGIFRSTIWNQTIPDRLRGRLAGVEMISYSSGPLLGNAESGLVAALAGVRVSVWSGGVLCMAGVAVCVAFLPRFWRYEAPER
jgi:MFS family permease